MNTVEIQERFGKEAKVIFVFRHGIKTPDGHITPECLAKIEAEGIAGAGININVIQEGSDFVRTKETVEALEKWVIKNNGKINRHIPSDSCLGNNAIFGFFTADVMNQMKTMGYGNYETLTVLGPQLQISWEADLENLISELFNQINPGDVCAVPCHSPTVEVLYNIYTALYDQKMTVKELEGCFLIMNPDGQIQSIR